MYDDSRVIEIAYHGVSDPEFVLMNPEKMRRYGVEGGAFKIEGGTAEVMGRAFSSGYHDNLAKALLLRNFAVFYLNKLLEVASDS